MPRVLPFDVDAKVEGHKPPLPPIELRPSWKSPPPNAIELLAIEIENGARKQDAARIWEITRQVAEGVNPPTED